MRQAHRIFEDAASEDFSCDLLFTRKTRVETIDQNVRINESGHARRGPLVSSPSPETGLSYTPKRACAAVPSPDRRTEASILDLGAPPLSPEGSRGSRHRRAHSRSHRPDGCCIVPRIVLGTVTWNLDVTLAIAIHPYCSKDRNLVDHAAAPTGIAQHRGLSTSSPVLTTRDRSNMAS